jgi:hypothetical protein
VEEGTRSLAEDAVHAAKWRWPDRWRALRDLSPELNVAQRHEDDYDRRYDVDGGHVVPSRTINNSDRRW